MSTSTTFKTTQPVTISLTTESSTSAIPTTIKYWNCLTQPARQTTYQHVLVNTSTRETKREHTAIDVEFDDEPTTSSHEPT